MQPDREVAGIGGPAQPVVQVVAEQDRRRFLRPVECFIGRLGRVEVDRQHAERIGQRRAIDGHAAIRPRLGIALIVEDQRHTGRLVRGEGQHGARIIAAIGGGSDEAVRLLRACDHAEQPTVVRIKRLVHVDAGAEQRIIARRQLDPPARPGIGQLAGQVDEPARRARAIGDTRRALHHIDRFDQMEIDLRAGIDAAQQAHPVHEHAGCEAAQEQLVVARGDIAALVGATPAT